MFLLPFHVTSITAGQRHGTWAETLQRVAAARGEADVALQRHGIPGVLIATCHRIELLTWGDADASAWITQWLSRIGVKSAELTVAQVSADQAVQSLIELIAGLRSPIRGEIEIQAQVRRAWRRAHDAGAANVELDDVVARSLAAARRVRGVSFSANSRRSLGTEVVREVIDRSAGWWHASKLLVVGTGDASASVLNALQVESSRTRVSLIGRTAQRVQELAARYACAPCDWSTLRARIAAADVVVFAVSTPSPLIDAADIAAGDTASRRRIWVDLGVPPCAIAPRDSGAIDYVSLEDLSDDSSMLADPLAGDAQAVKREMARFAADLERRRCRPWVGAGEYARDFVPGPRATA